MQVVARLGVFALSSAAERSPLENGYVPRRQPGLASIRSMCAKVFSAASSTTLHSPRTAASFVHGCSPAVARARRGVDSPLPRLDVNSPIEQRGPSYAAHKTHSVWAPDPPTSASSASRKIDYSDLRIWPPIHALSSIFTPRTAPSYSPAALLPPPLLPSPRCPFAPYTRFREENAAFVM
ncbi:hypothetical protein B0H13DRAFT_73727 [Mycena leptocephala]|nr:hypothetical protein B0H13DRAFT_73727 [Mycena leptocephala]